MSRRTGHKKGESERPPDMLDHKTPCPYCGHDNDCASVVGAKGVVLPKPGDVSVCATCGEVGFFFKEGEQIQVRRATTQEVMRISVEDDFLQVRRASAMIKMYKMTGRIVSRVPVIAVSPRGEIKGFGLEPPEFLDGLI